MAARIASGDLGPVGGHVRSNLWHNSLGRKPTVGVKLTTSHICTRAKALKWSSSLIQEGIVNNRNSGRERKTHSVGHQLKIEVDYRFWQIAVGGQSWLWLMVQVLGCHSATSPGWENNTVDKRLSILASWIATWETSNLRTNILTAANDTYKYIHFMMVSIKAMLYLWYFLN